MKKSFHLPSLLAFFLFLSIMGYGQCGTIPNLSGWNYGQNGVGVGIFKETVAGYEFIGNAYPGPATHVEVNLEDVSKLVFATICYNAAIELQGSVANIGSICSQNLECQEDLHFYTPPTQFDPYNYPLIYLRFSSFYPDVLVTLHLSACGLEPPSLLTPANDQDNLGAAVDFSWEAVPTATGYLFEIVEPCPAYQTTGYSVAGTSLSISGLNSNTCYLWRVKAVKVDCLEASWSVRHFCTGPCDIAGSVICTFFPQGSYSTSRHIICDAPISGSSSNVVLQSNSSLTLNPGFSVENGSTFTGNTN